MAGQMDALTSFMYLTENVPQWLEQLEDLSGHVAKRHTEFAAEYSRLLKRAQPRKQKTASLASNRSDDRMSDVEATSTKSSKAASSSIRNHLNPLEAGNKYLFANLRRTQKTSGQSVRSGASGPQRFRQKHAVVVYYDGSVQQRLDSMVKNINTARNNLRKGKRSRLLTTGPSLPSFNMSTFNFKADPYSSQATPDLFDLETKSTRPPPVNHDASFQDADKELEAAQALCETAAHQFLRDGDTKVEIENAMKKLELAMSLAEKTVASLKVEEGIAEPEEETPEMEDDKDVIDLSKFDKMTPHISFSATPQLATPVSKFEGLPVIEVDDDLGYEELDYLAEISNYRSMLRTRQ